MVGRWVGGRSEQLCFWRLFDEENGVEEALGGTRLGRGPCWPARRQWLGGWSHLYARPALDLNVEPFLCAPRFELQPFICAPRAPI